MHRIKQLFSKHTSLSGEGEDFLKKYGKIKSYDKEEIFVQQNQNNNLFGILLDGLVGNSITNKNFDNVLTKVITPLNYFVGTKHIYSSNGAAENIHFLKKSEAFIINVVHIKEAIKFFPEFNLMYHILKQQHITICINLLHIQQLKNEQKLIYFYRYFPDLKNQLTINQICSLLGFSNTRQYYSSLEKFLRHKEL
ncbi:cyclic nucleotide-binding domain-containing protein [Sphingobacterium bovistauri]|uniref:cAMP-binding domain of CRP or a regulatory subunit of cAMP-dependent protein kinases n=1 Tax=Sphingobacterium bovistauri TaxID=2781959 RepID=A0ABS7Z596_9SPHI|nr:hypothetical protein [Sphingobacterium bovistauri]MCA5004060.1 hypothetical protein [Sphingobacterium bovistauri]